MRRSAPISERLLPRLSPDIAALYLALHLSCLAALWTGVSAQALALCAASYWLRMFGLGVCYHRYFAHRAFKTSRPMQLVLALLGSLSVQRGVLWWAQTHREHHRHADTPRDLHSPRYHGFLYAHSGWFMSREHRRTDLSKVPDLAGFPELRFLNRWYYLLVVPYAAGTWLLLGWQGLVWGFCISTTLLLHTTHWIQSMSHSVGGYRRFDSPDESRNHWLLGVLSLGEWHNNHHYSPASARQGVAWWEIDVSYALLKVLSWLGLIWDLRPPPRPLERP